MRRNYTYDAFGGLKGRSGYTENSYQFGGEQFDKNLGEYYLRQRYYSQDTGRFIRRDTFAGSLSEPVSLHKYLYANANSVNFTDPTGLFSDAQSLNAALVGFAFIASIAYVGFVAAGPPPERLGEFGGGDQPDPPYDVARTGIRGVLDFGKLGGIEGVRTGVPNHTGRSGWDIDLVSHVFAASFRGPAARGFDWEHIMERHSPEGRIAQQRSNSSLFHGMTEDQIKRAVMRAWSSREKVETQDDLVTNERRIRYRGVDGESGYTIEIWFNQNTKQVETAYPVEGP